MRVWLNKSLRLCFAVSMHSFLCLNCYTCTTLFTCQLNRLLELIKHQHGLCGSIIFFFHVIVGLVCTGVIPVLEEQLDHVPEQCHSDHCKALRLLVQLCEKHSSVNKGEKPCTEIFQMTSCASLDDHDDYLSYSCEYLTVLAFASLRCHDYATTEQLALQG